MPSIQELIDQEFALQQARDYERFMASRRGVPRPPDMRDAAVELRQATHPEMTPVVDVNRTPLPPVREGKSSGPVKPEAYCKHCGKLFKAKTAGMAKMQCNRHVKKEHAGQSATA